MVVVSEKDFFPSSISGEQIVILTGQLLMDAVWLLKKIPRIRNVENSILKIKTALVNRVYVECYMANMNPVVINLALTFIFLYEQSDVSEQHTSCRYYAAINFQCVNKIREKKREKERES